MYILIRGYGAVRYVIRAFGYGYGMVGMYVPAFGYGYGGGTVGVRWGYRTGTVWVYSTSTVRRYRVLVQCTHGTCFQKKWYYFENVALIAAHFGNSTALSKNRYSGYATPCLAYRHTVPVPYPYPYRTRTVLLYSTRTVPVQYAHRTRTQCTYPLYVPIPTPKSYPVVVSPDTR